MTKVLITGASGFIGANLSQYLAAKGYEVYSLVRRFSAPRIKFIAGKTLMGDVSEVEDVSRAITSINPDVVCHTAMYGGNANQENTMEMFKTNVWGTIRMLEASHRCGVKLFINAGSSSEYGIDNDRKEEWEQACPITMYGYTKLLGTQYGEYLSRIQSDMKIITLRLFSVYGPLERDVRFVPDVLKHALQGELPLLRDPNSVRDFIYIDDVCRAYSEIIAAPKRSGVYNLGSGIQTTLDGAVGAIKQITSCSADPQWSNRDPRELEPKKWRANIDKFRTDYPTWGTASKFYAGVTQFADWLRRNPDVVIP